MPTTYYANKNVLITGAASGIGRLLAKRIGELGGHLILWDLNEPAVRILERELKSEGVPVAAYPCDLSNGDRLKETISRTLAEQHHVDILVNNAGVVHGKKLLDLTEAEIRHTFEVNTLAQYWTTRAFLPGMIERGRGHIVTIASAGGLGGTAQLTDYCGSKFASFGFDESLRAELAVERLPIHTTVVCPYYVDTGMFQGVRTRFPLLLPVLKPDYVVGRILREVARKKRRLIMPRFVYAVYLGRLLPVRWFDALQRLLGISTGMKDFTGR